MLYDNHGIAPIDVESGRGLKFQLAIDFESILYVAVLYVAVPGFGKMLTT